MKKEIDNTSVYTKKKLFSIKINIPDYKQNTSPWAEIKTDCSNTISDEGCIIVCSSMFFRERPDFHVAKLRRNNIPNCPYNFSDAARLYNKNHIRYSGDFESLKTEMFNLVVKSHIPVFVKLRGKYNNHFILTTGFRGIISCCEDYPEYSEINESMFLVNDPGYSDVCTLKDSLSGKYNEVDRIDTFI